MRKNRTSKLTLKSISNTITKNRIVISLAILVFLLRFPSLFEPLLNDRETYLLTHAAGLLPAKVVVSVFDLPLLVFVKTSFMLFGTTVWSVKFLLLIYYLVTTFVFIFLLEKTFNPKKTAVITAFLVLIFGLPYLGTNQVNWGLFIPLLLLISLFLCKYFPGLRKIMIDNLLMALVLTSLIMLVFNRNNLIKFSYYPDFINYTFAKIQNEPSAEENYFSTFDKNINQSYSLAFFIKQKTSSQDTLFVASDKIAIYFLANRKAASANIVINEKSNMDQTLTDISENLPAFILYEKTVQNFRELDRILDKSYNLTAQENDVKIYSRQIP